MLNTIINDSFNRVDGTVGNGWIETTPTTWSISDNKLVTTNTSSNILYRNDNKLNVYLTTTITTLDGVNILVSRYNTTTGDAYYALIVNISTNTYQLIIGKYSNNLNTVTNLSTVTFTSTATTLKLSLFTYSIYPTNLAAVVTDTNNTIISSTEITDNTTILQQTNKYGIRFASLTTTTANISNVVVYEEILNKVDFNSKNIVLSPYNWLKTNNTIFTNNTGSYIKLKFTGTSLRIRTNNYRQINASLPTNSYPQIKYTIDNKPFKTLQLSNSVTDLETNLTDTTHEAIIYISRFVYLGDVDRWLNPVLSLEITDIYIDDNKQFLEVSKNDTNILIYGDSITEGINLQSNGYSDATQSYSYYLANSINQEYGIVAFSGQAITKPINNGTTITSINVPKLSDSWNYYYNNVTRLINEKFNPIPNKIFINIGTNDLNELDSLVYENYIKLLTDIRKAVNKETIIFIVIPFGNYKKDIITKVYKDIVQKDSNIYLIKINDSLVKYFNFTITNNLYSDDSVHPNSLASPIIANNLIQNTKELETKLALKKQLEKQQINLKFDYVINAKYIRDYINN